MFSGEFFLQTSLLSAMLGASIGFCIEEGFGDPSAFRIIAIVALILHIVNFYHAKVGRLYDRAEQMATQARPFVHVSLILSNVLLFATFCVMALRIDTVAAIALGEVVVRIIDMATVAAQLRVGDRSPGRAAIDRSYAKQLWYWQYMNGITLVIFAAVFITSLSVSYRTAYPLAVCCLAVLVGIDLVIEYGVFTGNYFTGLSDWDRLAERWDQLQGEYGDRFRELIINPFVQAWSAQRAGPADTVIIDAGCGNGCTSRVLSRSGYSVVAFDKAARLVEISQLYRDSAIRYFTGNLEDPVLAAVAEAEVATTAKPCRAVLALFALQDCDNLGSAFSMIAAMLRKGEYLLVVYETAIAFEPSVVHTTTTRTWKYSRSGERKQVVSWLPVSEPNPTSVCADLRDDPDLLISTVTNFRTLDDYRTAAQVAGLTLGDSGVIQLSGKAKTLSELRYQQDPKFAFAEFVRMADASAGQSAPGAGTLDEDTVHVLHRGGGGT